MASRAHNLHHHRSDHVVHAGRPMVDAGHFAPAKRRRLSGPAMRTFLNIADKWQLSESERLMVLGLPGRSTYFGWISKARASEDLTLPLDALLRISAVLGVHKSLSILFGTDHEALGWLRGPHDAPTFGGQPPMALLINGTQDGIMLVRRYLDAFRGGTFAAPDADDQNAAPYTDDDIVIA
jgi:Protein of unknown function (DUF2384)